MLRKIIACAMSEPEFYEVLHFTTGYEVIFMDSTSVFFSHFDNRAFYKDEDGTTREVDYDVGVKMLGLELGDCQEG